MRDFSPSDSRWIVLSFDVRPRRVRWMDFVVWEHQPEEQCGL